jgi:transcriptional regulator with XRE-family HTH domain
MLVKDVRIAFVRKRADEKSFYKAFGELLAEARRKKSVSQETLADELELSRTSITNIEKGRQPIQLLSLYRIARLLQMDVKELLPSQSVLEADQSPPKLSVSKSEWLQAMDLTVPGEGTVADAHTGRKSKQTAK